MYMYSMGKSEVSDDVVIIASTIFLILHKISNDISNINFFCIYRNIVLKKFD